jgi:ligand-binding SRPBCC domain-containing protein
MKFVKTSEFAVPAAALWAFHERPDAFVQLAPPWQDMEVIDPPQSLAVGTIVRLRVRPRPFPFWQTVEAEHIAYEAGHMFADRMNKGPFASWVHHHIVEPKGDNASTLTDSIEYELPLGAVGRRLGSGIARRQLEKLFAYRHDVTRRLLAA